MRIDPMGLAFGIPGFLESFSFGFSGSSPLLDDDLLGIAGRVDIIARNCCGEDGREYLETVGSLSGGISLGAHGKLSGSRGQNIMLLSINSAGLPTCIDEATTVPPSFTFNAGSFSATFYPDSGQLEIGGGIGAGLSFTENFAKEWALGRVEIAECCNK